jgi:anthranilate phosphoribosyltransferase
MPARTLDLTSILETVAEGRALAADEAEAAFDTFMDGSASEIQMAGLLLALRAKGVAPSEIAGGVRALRKAMIPVVSADPSLLVDTAGTGGGAVTTFNISTAAAFVVAGAGVPVAKHGNRSFTSRCGSADVLEALGVRIELSPAAMAQVLDEAGIVFMFAPLLHPAMRHVGPVRRGLGVTTVMNILGPLSNPAGALRQVIGVADERLLGLVASALAELGHIRALVVHGAPGMDEVSPLGTTRVAELRDGTVREYDVVPEDLGFSRPTAEELAGGEPAENAAIIEAILAGRSGAARSAVVLNAAAALLASGRADEWPEAVAVAQRSIDDGSARKALEALKQATEATR